MNTSNILAALEIMGKGMEGIFVTILIIMVYQTDYDPILVKGLLFSFVAAFISHILAILVSKLLFRDKEDPNIWLTFFKKVL